MPRRSATPAHPDRRGSGAAQPRTLFVSHYGGRTGAPLLLLHLLQWVRANTTLRFEVLVLQDGPLVEEFSALARVHLIDLYGPPPAGSREAQLRNFGFDATADRLQGRRVRAGAAALGRYDAVYLNTALSAEALRLLPAVPPVVVTSLHETDTAFSHFIAEADRELLLEETDWFITCADVVSATLVGGFGVEHERVRRHHGFVSPVTEDRDGGRALRQTLGIPDDAVVVGGVGVVQWRKGPDLFVEVAAEVARRHPELEVHFVWAGAPDPHGDEPPLLEDAARLGIADRVHLLGEYGSPRELFGALDLFCLSSREDPFPLVMLEAALLGVPIVSFDNGGVVELAAASAGPDGPAVEVVGPLDVDAMAEAVGRLAGDPALRRDRAERARRHVEAEHLTEVAAPRLYDDLRRLDPVFR